METKPDFMKNTNIFIATEKQEINIIRSNTIMEISAPQGADIR